MHLTQNHINSLPKNYFTGMDLSYANFSGLKILNFSFSNLKMEGINFSNSTITGCSFVNSDLTGAILDFTNFSYISFHHCYLGNINFISSIGKTSINFGGSKINDKTVGIPEYIKLKILPNSEYNFNRNIVHIWNNAL